MGPSHPLPRPQAMAGRFLSGLLSGNVCILKSFLADVTDASNRTRVRLWCGGLEITKDTVATHIPPREVFTPTGRAVKTGGLHSKEVRRILIWLPKQKVPTRSWMLLCWGGDMFDLHSFVCVDTKWRPVKPAVVNAPWNDFINSSYENHIGDTQTILAQSLKSYFKRPFFHQPTIAFHLSAFFCRHAGKANKGVANFLAQFFRVSVLQESYKTIPMYFLVGSGASARHPLFPTAPHPRNRFPFSFCQLCNIIFVRGISTAPFGRLYILG